MNAHDILSQALEAAKQQGHTASFRMAAEGLECVETGQVYRPEDILIVNHDRFEGASSEDDAAVLYWITTQDGTAGVIVDAYGTYANPQLADFLRDVPVQEP